MSDRRLGMKGTYEIRISNAKLSFTLQIERNITVIRGDSATGKTTFVEMLQDYEQNGRSSGVVIQSQKPCRVLTSVDWEYRLSGIQDSFIFIDEGNAFARSEAFARAIQGSSNYYVIITRENLYQLPYSVSSILKLKKTNKRQKTYVRSYPLYDHLADPVESIINVQEILTEDSNSGHEMFAYIGKQNGVACISAQGKSNVFSVLAEHTTGRVLVIADGAAFGAELEKIHQLMESYPKRIVLYLPESFEWLVLKSGILGGQTPDEILRNPADSIESSLYSSWEQYFTDLLVALTKDTVLHYSKRHLNPAYLQPGNVAKILEAMKG